MPLSPFLGIKVALDPPHSFVVPFPWTHSSACKWQSTPSARPSNGVNIVPFFLPSRQEDNHLLLVPFHPLGFLKVDVFFGQLEKFVVVRWGPRHHISKNSSF